MKALVLVEYNNFELKDVDKPSIEPGEVLVKIKACAICGSDVHGMDGSSGRRIPPIIMGHEAAGVIEEIGADVTKYKVGQRVTFDSTAYCGDCEYCSNGQVNLCGTRQVFGVSCGDYRRHGAFAEYVAVSEHILYPVPDNVTFEQAAMVEPLAIALHGVSRVNLKGKDTAVVIGAGMIGLLVIAALKEKGVKTVISADVNNSRLELSKEFGADHTINTKESDAIKEILALTGGEGAHISFEVVGLTETVELAVNCTRKGGSIGLIGNISKTAAIPLQAVVTKEISLFGSCSCAGEYGESLDLISNKKINVDKLMSGVAPLSEGQSMFKRLYGGKEDLMKIILVP